MKLWISGGQNDNFYECDGGDKCRDCSLRFKCYTSKILHWQNLKVDEVCTFIRKSKEV